MKGVSVSNEVFFALLLIFGGCIINNFVLEILVRADPGIGNLLTFLHFLFVTLESFCINFDFRKWRLIPRRTPFSVYMFSTCIFVTLSVINNKAFDYHISQPIHMVIRSSTLLATLTLGLLFFQKKYTSTQITGVLVLTVGVLLVTIAEGFTKQSSRTIKECSGCSPDILPVTGNNNFEDMTTWIIGVSMLFIALFLSSLIGHLQELTRESYHAPWNEGLFYTHALGLPYFVLVTSDIKVHASIVSNSPLLSFGDSISIPSLWFYLFLNVISQIACVHGVYILQGAQGTLTCTLVLTIRKFASLVFSIMYFKNPFTVNHWIGSLLVFIGGAIYAVPRKSKAKEE